jgi:hypothetical protein
MMDDYDIAVPDENLNPQVDLSGYTANNDTWNDTREPLGIPSTQSVALSQNNSMADRGRGDALGASNVWERTSANILQSLAQTGINVYAARNGVYASGQPQNTQSLPSPALLRQQQQAKTQGLLTLAMIAGVVYVLANKG